MYCTTFSGRPKRLACINSPLHSKDLIPRESMVAAVHTPCQGGRYVAQGGRQGVAGGGDAQRSEAGDSVWTMGKVRRFTGQSR